MTTTVQRQLTAEGGQRHMHEVHKIAHAGAVDADGHILEPPDLWEEYLEDRYKDRALRIEIEPERGLEVLMIDNQRSKLARPGMVSTLGAMGAPDLPDIMFNPDRTYVGEIPYGAMDPHQRIELLDAEGLDIAVLLPTMGLLWEAELEDAELSQAYTRAYNRWICEFCRDHSDRLVPVAHISMTDPVAAAAELRRSVADGARGCFVAPFTHSTRPLGHADHDPVFEAAQDLGVPFAIHPTFEPQWTKGTRMGTWEHVRELRLTASMTASDGVRHQFVSLFDYGVFERFPELKVLVLESGGGWLGYCLDRIDAVFGHTYTGTRVPLQMKPSEYFMRQVWISCDPDERSIPALAQRYGHDRFMWASDFPHADHTPEYVLDLDELVDMFPAEWQRAFVGDNARAVFDL